ncbi:MAG: restriction system protein [Thermoplasmata archaeon]|jgi:restriction system protein|nr:restriction system protein [Thermoplasmata archaeon]
MSNVNNERTGEFLRKLFGILQSHPTGIPAKQALSELAKTVKLNEYEAGNYDSGPRRFDQIVRFATVDATKAGWMIKDKGIWSVTPAGVDALKQFPHYSNFYREAKRLYQAWSNAQPEPLQAAAAPETQLTEEAVEQSSRNLTVTFERASDDSWSEVATFLEKMPPFDFQKMVAGLIEGMGYFVGWIAPPGKDGGADIVAFNDPLGTKDPRIKVQAKRQESGVGATEVRSFHGILKDRDVGIFVCTGGFSKDAEDFVRREAQHQITLIDMRRLFALWVEYYTKLDNETRRRMPLKPVHFLAPPE